MTLYHGSNADIDCIDLTRGLWQSRGQAPGAVFLGTDPTALNKFKDTDLF